MSQSCELSDLFLFLYGLPSVCGNTPIHVLTVTPHDALTLLVTVVTSRSSRSTAFHCLPLCVYTYLYVQLHSVYKAPLSDPVLVSHLDLLVVGNQVCLFSTLFPQYNLVIGNQSLSLAPLLVTPSPSTPSTRRRS